MGTGKSSLVLRYLKGEFVEFQVCVVFPCESYRGIQGLKKNYVVLPCHVCVYILQESTIGAAFFTQTVVINDETVRFEIWDTAGQERYHCLAPMYYRGSAAAVVVYDITNPVSEIGLYSKSTWLIMVPLLMHI